jgi:hypothetical protein
MINRSSQTLRSAAAQNIIGTPETMKELVRQIKMNLKLIMTSKQVRIDSLFVHICSTNASLYASVMLSSSVQNKRLLRLGARFLRGQTLGLLMQIASDTVHLDMIQEPSDQERKNDTDGKQKVVEEDSLIGILVVIQDRIRPPSRVIGTAGMNIVEVST